MVLSIPLSFLTLQGFPATRAPLCRWVGLFLNGLIGLESEVLIDGLSFFFLVAVVVETEANLVADGGFLVVAEVLAG